MFSILAAGFFFSLIAIIWVLSALMLIFVVLIQKGKGGGLSGIFGSGMAGSLLGADTKKPMTWFTIGLVCVFLFLGVLLAKLSRPSVSSIPETAPAGQTTTAGGQLPTETQQGAPAGGATETVPPVTDVNLM